MRTLAVIHLAPGVERLLTVPCVAERARRRATAADHLGLERAVEALVLALGLRVQRPAVGHVHTAADQPGRQRRPVPVGPEAAPRRALVPQDRPRPALRAPPVNKRLLGRLGL